MNSGNHSTFLDCPFYFIQRERERIENQYIIWMMMMIIKKDGNGMNIQYMFLILFNMMIYYCNGSTTYWNQLGLGNTWYEKSGFAFCEDLNILFRYGGTSSNHDDDLSSDAWVFNITSGNEVSLCTSCAPGERLNPVLVNVPSVNGACRFLLFGVPFVRNIQQVFTDNYVWLVTIDSQLQSTFTQLSVGGGKSPSPRAECRGIGYGNNMLIAGGLIKLSYSIRYLDDIWRFSLENSTYGVWTEINTDGASFPTRSEYGSGFDGTNWIIHGGKGTSVTSPGATVVRSDMYVLPVDQLINSNAATQASIIANAQRIDMYGSSTIFIKDHSLAVVGGNAVVYGGSSLQSAHSMFESMDPVLVTQVYDDSYKCNYNSIDTAWCGFWPEYPGLSAAATSVQSGTYLYVYVGDKYWRLSLGAVLSSEGQSQYKAQEGYSDGMINGTTLQILQFTLVAVCVIFFISMVLLLRHRRRYMLEIRSFPAAFSNPKPPPVTLSEAEIDNIPVIKYQPELPTPRTAAANEHLPDDCVKTDMCPICLVEFEEDEQLKILPCNHLFHEKCIKPWLMMSNNCPMCKLDVRAALAETTRTPVIAYAVEENRPTNPNVPRPMASFSIENEHNPSFRTPVVSSV